MKVTEVKIDIVQNSSDHLRAFAKVVLDGCFIIHDIRVLEGTQGLFLAMPSRKIMLPCPRCRSKNAVMAKFCNNCGGKLPIHDPVPGERIYADTCHPINAEFRAELHEAVIAEYLKAFSTVSSS